MTNALEEGEVVEIGCGAYPVALGGGAWLCELPGGQMVGAVYGR